MGELPTGIVTFLFTDIEGSTRLWEQQPHAMQAALARHDALLRQVIATHGGHVFKTIGDAFCSAFARPEDAVAAAIAAQCALEGEEGAAVSGQRSGVSGQTPNTEHQGPNSLPPLRVRMAVHTGAAEYREGDYFGPALNRVARLLAAGHGGQVLLSSATAGQLPPSLLAEVNLRPLGVHRLRDITARELIFQLLAPGLPARFPPLNTLDVAFRRGVVRAAAVAMVVVAVVASLAVTAVQEARRAEQQRRLAQEGQRALRRSQYADRLSLAQQAVDEGNLRHAQELLDAVRPGPGEEDLRGFEWRYLWRRCQGEALATLDDHRGGVITVAFSPDGKLLAASGWGHGLRLWDVARRQEIAVFKVPADWVIGLAFSPDGKTLAAAVNGASAPSVDGVTLWDIASRRQIAVLPGQRDVRELAFSPDGRLLALASAGDQTVRLWASTHFVGTRRSDAGGPRLPWRPIATIKDHPNSLEVLPCLVFSPDSKLLVTRTRGGPIHLWDVAGCARAPQTRRKAGPRLVATLGESLAPIMSAAFSPDGKSLATGSSDNGVRLWDLATKRAVATLWGHTQRVQAVAFSPDGKTLASGSWDSTVKLWDLASRRELSTFKGHKGDVLGVAFSPDGKLLASGGREGTVNLWAGAPTGAGNRSEATQGDGALRAGTADVIRQKDPFDAVAFSPDGRVLAAGSEDGTVGLWDANTRRPLAALRGQKRGVWSLAFSPDGRLLASGSDDNTLALWEQERSDARGARRAIVTLPGLPDFPRDIAFSPDGRTLAWQGQTAVKLWDVATRRVTATLPWEKGNESCLAFSPDGKTLAVANGPAGAILWDVASRRAAGRLNASALFFFSPDGKMLAQPANRDQVKLWELASCRLLATVGLHADITSGVAAFSPDGRTLAVPCGTGVSLINMAARQEAAILKGQAAAVNGVAFSPDGSTLASSASDGTVSFWHAATFQETDPLQMASVTSDRSVTLQWQPLPSAVGYHLYRGPAGAGPARPGTQRSWVRLATLPAGAASFTDRSPGLVNGRPQTYSAAAVFPTAGGRTIEGPRVSLQATPVAVPPGWLGASIDEGAHPGSALFDPSTGTIRIRGSGGDMFSTTDQFYYLCRPVQGDFQITVRALTRPTATFPWAKAGLMIRDSTAAEARAAYLIITPAAGLRFEWRSAANGSGGDAGVLEDKQLKLPILLRLTRQGDTVTATYSRDGGQHFLPAGAPFAFDEPLPGTVYAGLAITAHDADRVSEARFDDLRVEALPAVGGR